MRRHFQKSKRISIWLLAPMGILICGLWPRFTFAGSNSTTDQGTVLRWPSIPQVTFQINPGGVPGFTSELGRLIVAGAVRDSFRAWSEVPNAAIAFTDGGLTSQAAVNPNDGISQVTFQDPSFSYPPSVLAVTRTAYFSDGVLVDADILFNPQPSSGSFSPVGADDSIDLIAVAVHEIGHLLGLDHTGVFSSIMNPYAESSGGGVYSRTIRSDDAITAAALYPLATFAPSTATLSGNITASGGTPVRSAHIVAISVPDGAPVASQLSDPSGNYLIQGLSPGSYNLFVEPLDGPIRLSNWQGPYYSEGQRDFTSAMHGGFATPTVFNLAAGQGAVANVALPPNPATKLNIDSIGIFSDTNCQFGNIFFQPGILYLPRGRSYCVMMQEASNSSDTSMTFSSPDVARLGDTTLTDFGAGILARSQRISIGASAATGPSNAALSNNNANTTLPGGIVVTVNPAVATPMRDGAGFETTLAPGGFISIFGTDLAKELELATDVPLPTNLGDVSVKIGNRFAPLFFVSPGQINALVPFEVSGIVNVQVVAGPGATGNSVPLTLSPTAPGIFSTTQTGSGQGAILNADDSFVALEGSIPGAASHPARPGDVVVIFASGLGPVSPAIPSGLSAGAGGTSNPLMVNFPTVRIGGQVAALDYAGLAPGFVGLYQVNAHIPAGISTGSAVPVQITTFEGQTSNTVTIAVNP